MSRLHSDARRGANPHSAAYFSQALAPGDPSTEARRGANLQLAAYFSQALAPGTTFSMERLDFCNLSCWISVFLYRNFVFCENSLFSRRLSVMLSRQGRMCLRCACDVLAVCLRGAVCFLWPPAGPSGPRTTCGKQFWTADDLQKTIPGRGRPAENNSGPADDLSPTIHGHSAYY